METTAIKLSKNPLTYNFWNKHISHPKKQACKNIGVGHWDHECPSPYGNEKLQVTHKLCSINLKMYKLVNRL